MVYLGLSIKNGDFPWLCQITRWYLISQGKMLTLFPMHLSLRARNCIATHHSSVPITRLGRYRLPKHFLAFHPPKLSWSLQELSFFIIWMGQEGDPLKISWLIIIFPTKKCWKMAMFKWPQPFFATQLTGVNPGGNLSHEKSPVSGPSVPIAQQVSRWLYDF